MELYQKIKNNVFLRVGKKQNFQLKFLTSIEMLQYFFKELWLEMKYSFTNTEDKAQNDGYLGFKWSSQSKSTETKCKGHGKMIYRDAQSILLDALLETKKKPVSYSDEFWESHPKF